MSEQPDLLGALGRAIDAARQERRERPHARCRSHCAVCGHCGPFIDGCPTCRRVTPIRETCA